MAERVDVFFSLQSDYCYFLLDRLLALQAKGVEVAIRPVLGGLLRLPDRYRDRDALEQTYFQTDTQRIADMLGIPYAYPDPSPIQMAPGSLWIAEPDQPLNRYLNRLYVGAAQRGQALAFLDHVARMLWDGSTPGWDQGDHLKTAMARAGMDLDEILNTTPWEQAETFLEANAKAILQAGHWGVPLMVYKDEPFYGQDRFDHLVWRMTQTKTAQDENQNGSD